MLLRFKYLIIANIRRISQRSFDLNLSFFKLIISLALSLPRGAIVRLIRYLDLLFPPFFGATQTRIVRQIIEDDVSISITTTNPHVDLRCLIWKRDAFNILIKLILKEKIKDIRLLEVGAANGIVSLMIAEWSKKHQIAYKGICVEPNFANIDFLQQMIIKNKHDIKIIPCVINENDRWTSFEDVGNKGLVDKGVKDKKKQVFRYSLKIDEIMSSIFKPNIIYIDALKNEIPIVDQLIKHCSNNTHLLVEFDEGIPENLKQKLDNNNFKILKVNDLSYILSKT